MMYRWTCNRRQFLDFMTNGIIAQKMDLSRTRDLTHLSLDRESIELIWQTSPQKAFDLPNAAIVSEDVAKDFSAWISTYFRHIRPFTAHCRVLTPSNAMLAALSSSEFTRPEVGFSEIGLILAEGITYSVGRADHNRLPFHAFARTLSFCLTQASARFPEVFGENLQISNSIADSWVLAREYSKQPTVQLPARAISGVWQILFNSFEERRSWRTSEVSDSSLANALQEIRKSGCMSGTTWKTLTESIPNAEFLSESMRGPKETRVVAVEGLLKELLRSNDRARSRSAFIAGYVASQIQPGTFDHLSILFPALPELPECLLWFGVCAGLTPESSIANYDGGIGWLLKRESTRPTHWLNRPECDIAVSEMAILLRSEEAEMPVLRTIESDLLKVEVFPLITTNTKWPRSREESNRRDDRSLGYQSTLFDDDVYSRRDMFDLITRMDKSARDISEMRRLLEKKLGEKVPRSSKRYQS